MAATVAVIALTLFVVFHAMVRSIRNQRDRRRPLLREFALSILFATLFVLSWLGQLVTEWQVFTDDARSAIAMASAAAVPSSSSEALATSRPVRSQIMVWKLNSASSRPWLISG